MKKVFFYSCPMHFLSYLWVLLSSLRMVGAKLAKNCQKIAHDLVRTRGSATVIVFHGQVCRLGCQIVSQQLLLLSRAAHWQQSQSRGSEKKSLSPFSLTVASRSRPSFRSCWREQIDVLSVSNKMEDSNERDLARPTRLSRSLVLIL